MRSSARLQQRIAPSPNASITTPRVLRAAVVKSPEAHSGASSTRAIRAPAKRGRGTDKIAVNRDASTDGDYESKDGDYESDEGGEHPACPKLIMKLWKTLNDPAYASYITWAPDGDGFIVLNHPQFCSNDQVKKVFNYAHFPSFVSRVSAYGFRKGNRESKSQRGAQEAKVWHFVHPHFIRDKPELLHLITLKSPKSKNTTRSGVTPEQSTLDDAQLDVRVDGPLVDFGLHMFETLPSKTVDHTKLTDALRKTLKALSHLSLSSSQLQDIPNATVAFGGYGDVRPANFRAGSQRSANLKVAVKKLRPIGDLSQQLRVAVALAREVQVWSTLDHENITRLVGYHFDPRVGANWLISPWEEYGSISNFLETNDLSTEERLQLVLDTLKALVYMHERSPAVCHGDLKPANVLINGLRRAMLCDFGLARAMENLPSGLTTTRTIVGTTRYASPEVVVHAKPRTLASDVWSWGCLFFEIATGIVPYSNVKADTAVIIAMYKEDHPAASADFTLPLNLMELLRACWYASPDDRPTALSCSKVLEAAIGVYGEAVQSKSFEWSRTPPTRV